MTQSAKFGSSCGTVGQTLQSPVVYRIQDEKQGFQRQFGIATNAGRLYNLGLLQMGKLCTIFLIRLWRID